MKWVRLQVISGLMLFLSVACSPSRSATNTVAETNASRNSTDESKLVRMSGSSDAKVNGNDRLSIAIPEIELGDELQLKVQIANDDSIPMIDGDFALIYTVSYIIAPDPSLSREVSKIVDETAAGRLIGEQDFFLTPLQTFESGTVKEIDVAKFPLKRVLDKFYLGADQIPNGKSDLRVLVVVLEARLIDRSANVIGTSRKNIYLTRDRNGEKILFGYRKK